MRKIFLIQRLVFWGLQSGFGSTMRFPEGEFWRLRVCKNTAILHLFSAEYNDTVD
jgi:hypothetical protein